MGEKIKYCIFSLMVFKQTPKVVEFLKSVSFPIMLTYMIVVIIKIAAYPHY